MNNMNDLNNILSVLMNFNQTGLNWVEEEVADQMYKYHVHNDINRKDWGSIGVFYNGDGIHEYDLNKGSYNSNDPNRPIYNKNLDPWVTDGLKHVKKIVLDKYPKYSKEIDEFINQYERYWQSGNYYKAFAGRLKTRGCINNQDIQNDIDEFLYFKEPGKHPAPPRFQPWTIEKERKLLGMNGDKPIKGPKVITSDSIPPMGVLVSCSSSSTSNTSDSSDNESSTDSD
jgi:hypothetical protein